jgi:hypothetical protein
MATFSLSSITGGAGAVVEGLFDRLGLPEPLGDVAAGLTNLATGNYAGAILDGFDLAQNLLQGAKPTPMTEPPPPEPRQGLEGAFVQGADARTPKAGSGKGGPGTPGFDAAAALTDINEGKKPSWMAQKDWDEFELQKKMQDYMRMITLLTNLMKMQHEATMAIARNISV